MTSVLAGSRRRFFRVIMTPRRRRTEGQGRTLRVPSTDWTLVRANLAVARLLLARQCPALLDRGAVVVSKANQQGAGHPHNLLAVVSINTLLATRLTNHPLLVIQNNLLVTPQLPLQANTPPSQLKHLAIIAVVKISHPQGTGLDRRRNHRFLLLATDQAVTADLSHTVVPLVSHCQKNK